MGVKLMYCKLTLLLLTLVSIQSFGYSGFPKEFQDKWTVNKDLCDKYLNPSSLVISEGEVSFWESIGIVKSISKQDESLNVHFHMEGEGQRWISEETYTLSRDGKVLMRSAEEYFFKYVRCIK
ncbi:hypothetical protein [Microbulbifer epialgicus]|uniref:Uncharacterized protein n=1 Tax=Microbulbifer epialgicus TaxID=393907 RepID=A0ABV4P6E9_9GAMM